MGTSAEFSSRADRAGRRKRHHLLHGDRHRCGRQCLRTARRPSPIPRTRSRRPHRRSPAPIRPPRPTTTTPRSSGNAEAGSTVHIYKSANCSGTAAATGTAAQFATGLTVAVTENAESSLTATATDAAGNVSGCSSAVSYTEDSIAPATPTITETNPASPANNDNPVVKGTVGEGSPTHVKIYTTNDCSGAAATTGTPADSPAGCTSTSPTTPRPRSRLPPPMRPATSRIAHPQSATPRTRSRRNRDHPRTAFARRIVTAIRKRKVRRARLVQVSFSFTSNDSTAHFECELDGAPFSPCSSPRVYGKVKLGPHSFSCEP